MGIFTRRTKDEREVRTDALIKRLEISSDVYMQAMGTKMARIKKFPDEYVMKPYYLYTDCLEMIMANEKNFKSDKYDEALTYGEEIYRHIFIYEEETPNFDELEMVFIELFDENSAVSRKCFDPAFFNLFTNKHNYVKWLRGIERYGGMGKIGNYILEYAQEARAYFIDEDQFTANVINVSLKLYQAANVQAVLSAELAKVARMAGIYNVDETRILQAEQNLAGAEAMIKKASDVLGVVDERMKSIDAVTETACGKVKQLCDAQMVAARAELDGIDIKMKLAYEELIQGQQQKLQYDREQFIKELFAQAEKKLEELKKNAKGIVNTASLELTKLNYESGVAINKLDSYLQDDQRFKQLMADVQANQDLMDKVDKLMILNDRNIEQLTKQAEAIEQEQAKAAEAKRAEEALKATQTEQVAAAEPQRVVVAQAPTVATAPEVVMVTAEDDVADQTVSPVLDERISFKERYKAVMQKKAEMVKNGVHFHQAFDDVLVAVMEGANPYLIGPSGCGKTFMVAQIANLLGLEHIDIGYINEEYDILGFQTANGGYSRPNFYRCYKYGKIAFCDELDNGNSRATVKLNSFLSNTEDAYYSFPNGENVKRHPNFRMIAAGNTMGNGADSNYNTREKIEESVQQRMMPIIVGYDNAVEEKILGKYKDWFAFVVLFRNATDEWGKGNYGDAPGIITTRDVSKIKKYLDHGSFGVEKIIDYEFIQTKTPDYLGFLSSYMKKNMKPGNPAASLVNVFNRRVEEIRRQ